MTASSRTPTARPVAGTWTAMSFVVLSEANEMPVKTGSASS